VVPDGRAAILGPMGVALLKPWWKHEGTRKIGLLATVAGGFFLVVVFAMMPALSLSVEVFAIALLAAAAALILFDPAGSLPVVFGMFAILGTLRRVNADLSGHFPSLDPLLIIPPACVLLAFAVAVHRGAMRRRTPISSSVLVLNLLALVGAFNPLQGGLQTGITGLVLLLTPILWFWVGRALVADRQLSRIFGTAVWLGVPIAVYGLFQTFGAFPGYDRAWANFVGPGYTSIYVSGHLRPFASFASDAEYGTFLAVGIIVLGARVMSGKDRLTLVNTLVIGLLSVALFLSSLRGATILCLVALAIMLAARRRAGITRLGVYGAVALVALFLLASRLGGGSGAGNASQTGSGSSALLSHQVSGLSDPLNSKTSTAGIHVTIIVQALAQMLHNPIGYGTGVGRKASTVSPAAGGAASKANTAGSSGFVHATDADPGNLAISWGVIGLVAYLTLAGFSLVRAYRLAMRRRDWLSYAVLGILVAVLLRWFSDMYAVLPLLWMCFGWLDRTTAEQASLDLS
jgi:hypothetical protein